MNDAASQPDAPQRPRGEPAAGSQATPLAAVRVNVPVSIIVPTYKEAQSLPLLLAAIDLAAQAGGYEVEVLVMDDQSDDGSVEAVESFGKPWAKIVVREGERGLSAAVVDGLKLATHDTCVVMDADLSHPPAKIPELLLQLSDGCKLAIGSRYLAGGSTSHDWGFFRYMNSLIATALARPLTDCTDPMAGFFAVRKQDVMAVENRLDPVGYKIALELIVKLQAPHVGEVPIHFENRRLGQSKLGLREQWLYLEHLRRLYTYRYTEWSHFGQYLIVGGISLCVNLGTLIAMRLLGFDKLTSIGGGILLSVTCSFLLNRRFTFSYARHRDPKPQVLTYAIAASIGMLVQFGAAAAAVAVLPDWLPTIWPALIGMVPGTLFTFLASRYVVFRKKRLRTKSPGEGQST